MAVTGSTHFTLLFLAAALSFLSPTAHSRLVSTAGRTTTTPLDVSDSLAKASRVLSFDPQTDQSFLQQQHYPDNRHRRGPNSLLSFELHPRHSLRRTTHKDYKALTLARLRRDGARVDSLIARLNLAADGTKRSDLKPQVTSEIMVSAVEGGMQGPVVSGTSQGSGEYFSRVGIGSPAKDLYMVLDTGSDVTWVQCQPCSDCYQQADPIYDPSASSSYSQLRCDSAQCRYLDVSTCRNSSCLYQISYGDGSYTVGDFATETVSFKNGGPSSGVPNVAFGCGHDNEGLFVGAAGLLGLGGGSLSFPSQVSATSFSYCLVDRDSTASSTLDFGRNASSSEGDFSPAAPTSTSTAAVTAPLLRNRKVDTFYYVGMTGMSVGGRPLSIPATAFSMDEAGNGGVIIDSGTAVTRLHPEAYTAVRDAFKAGARGLPSAAGVALFDTCYDLSGRTSVEVPTVALEFGDGKTLRLPAKNYLIPVDGSGTFCLAFAPTSASAGLSIIGNVQQQGTRVTFDMENASVGFESNKC